MYIPPREELEKTNKSELIDLIGKMYEDLGSSSRAIDRAHQENNSLRNQIIDTNKALVRFLNKG